MTFPSIFLLSPLENVYRAGRMGKELYFSVPQGEAQCGLRWRHWRWEAIEMDSDIYPMRKPKNGAWNAIGVP